MTLKINESPNYQIKRQSTMLLSLTFKVYNQFIPCIGMIYCIQRIIPKDRNIRRNVFTKWYFFWGDCSSQYNMNENITNDMKSFKKWNKMKMNDAFNNILNDRICLVHVHWNINSVFVLETSVFFKNHILLICIA